jgi:hypothetical protein
MESLSSSNQHWIGVDVSKATFDAALWGHQDFQTMAMAAFPRTEEGVGAFRTWVLAHGGDRIGVAMEATGSYSQELAEWLQRDLPESQVAIVNPSLVKAFGRSLALRNKTDRLDACMLARYGHERTPKAWVPMTPERAELLHSGATARPRRGTKPRGAAMGVPVTALPLRPWPAPWPCDHLPAQEKLLLPPCFQTHHIVRSPSSVIILATTSRRGQ